MCQAKDHRSYYDDSRVTEDVRRECDTLVFGSLVKGLKGLGIWPTTLPFEDYHGSVQDLVKSLRSLHCFALGEREGSDKHDGCKFTKRLDSEIKRIEQSTVALGVHDSHREHMKQQAQK